MVGIIFLFMLLFLIFGGCAICLPEPVRTVFNIMLIVAGIINIVGKIINGFFDIELTDEEDE